MVGVINLRVHISAEVTHVIAESAVPQCLLLVIYFRGFDSLWIGLASVAFHSLALWVSIANMRPSWNDESLYLLL